MVANVINTSPWYHSIAPQKVVKVEQAPTHPSFIELDENTQFG